MIHCVECNFEVASEDIFCPHCGVSINSISINATPDEVVESSPNRQESEIDFAEQPNESAQAATVASENIEQPSDNVDQLLPEEIQTADEPVAIDNEIEIPSGEMEKAESKIAKDDDLNPKAGDSFDGRKTDAGATGVKIVKTEKAATDLAATVHNIGKIATGGSEKSKLKPLEDGIVLNDRYTIVRKIGGGGMGAVYLAKDNNLGGVYRAVKEMVQSYIGAEQQEKAVQDFKRESMLLTTLEHAAIPTIYDYFFDDKEARFYLVMKYIAGGDLAGKLTAAPEGKIAEATVVSWGIQIADVLDYLHNHNPPIIYRDLKPANIMVDAKTEKVMLIDFGIARWVNKEEKGVTAIGTMGYAPPELFSGNVEARSDIYSLGSTMFHLLTGADPQGNPLLIFDFQKNPRPREIAASLSDQIERVLMKSVSYDLEDRYRSASDMRDALRTHLRSLKSGEASFGIAESPVAVSLSEQPVFCGFCGQKIVATDMFCAFCGAKQPMAQSGAHLENIPIFGGATAKIVIEGTSELEAKAFTLVKDENLVGRRDPISNIFPEVDLSKYDPQSKVSREHAKIWRGDGKFWLEDLNSANGTALIGKGNVPTKLAAHQSMALSNGDSIKIGDTLLHFRLV